MSLTVLRYRGREIRPEDAAFIQRLITENPGWSRRRLSAELCRAWNWVQPNGALRDMVCRSLLLQLHRTRLIALPAKRFSPPNNVVARPAPAPTLPLWERPRECSLGELGPLEIRQVRRTAQEALFGQLMEAYHYLRYTQPVGEHLKYLVFAGGDPIAALAWSSAPRHLAARDRFIGWPAEARGRHLPLIAYNTRFLILPWVKVRYLASHLLGRVARRISEDWQALYAHPIHLLETFIDPARFRGSSYRADGSGMPFYRLEQWQRSLGVPLAASTQWELAEAVARVAQPAWDHLAWVAAQAPNLFNDDTTMRVGALRRQIQAETKPERTGIFTTGIIASAQNHPIALFFTGRQHAGENLDQVLRQRPADLPPPLQMCDGLSRNEPQGFKTILGCCLAHGRRPFVEAISNFPEECRHVLESLRTVYRFDAQTKADGLNPEARLHFHQTHSQPVMDDLQSWLQNQINEKRVEPNSGLGQAIGYMLGHWQPLTLFLRRPGAPLDNNVCERALKMAIMHRKNSLSCKTERGAQVGDLFMSLIHTCRLNRVNPFDYLMALVRQAKQVRAHPDQWLPWNYLQTQATVAPVTDTG